LEVWHAIVLGLVEGITEYLPVSSTGHLILASWLLGLETPEQKAALDSFNVVVQGGAILAVLGLYWPRVVQMVRGLLGKDAAGFKLLLNLTIAFVPAAVVGLLLERKIEKYLFFAGPVVLSMIVGGVFMILVDAWRGGRIGRKPYHGRGKEITDLEPLDALMIGVLQCVSLWPGTSRSMMTITGGLIAGLKPKAAAEFSFLLGLPTLGGACAYSLLKDYLHAKKNGTPTLFGVLGVGPVAIGMVVAAISAAVAVRWLVGFLNKHGLAPFGWYRIVLGIVLLALSGWGVLKIG
jgi:undecaprenyl-diphosphatase